MKKYVIYSEYGILNGKMFVKDFDRSLWNMTEKEIEILSEGPENSNYRETWNRILKDRYFEEDGKKFHMEEDENYVLYLVEEQKWKLTTEELFVVDVRVVEEFQCPFHFKKFPIIVVRMEKHLLMKIVSFVMGQDG